MPVWPASFTARVATDGLRQPPALLRGPWTAARTKSAAEASFSKLWAVQTMLHSACTFSSPVTGIGGTRAPA